MEIPNDLRQRVDRELEPGEQIQWIGTPIPRPFTATTTFGILLGIVFVGFGISWMRTVPGFPFVLVGLAVSIGGLNTLAAPLWAYREARQTVYGITDRRAFIFYGGRSPGIVNYSASAVQVVYCQQNTDGSGDVVFGYGESDGNDGRTYAQGPGFFGVREPKEVERLLRQLAEPIIARRRG